MVSTVRLSLSCEYPGPSPRLEAIVYRRQLALRARAELAPLSNIPPSTTSESRTSSKILGHSRTFSNILAGILSHPLVYPPRHTSVHFPSLLHALPSLFHALPSLFHRSSIALPPLFRPTSLPMAVVWD
jgi:hypothetical protein